MALRKIVTVGDPILTKVCRPVTKFDQKLAILIEDMIETMHEANGVGLAGPQVGVMRRLCVVDTGEEDVELVNPEIVEVSAETQTGVEGCLSLPGKYGIVTRPEHVVIRAQDRNGDWYEYEGDDIVARCFLHEIDHLDGHMYTEIAEKMLTPEELASLRERCGAAVFFSEELCARYFTYRTGSENHYVLFDDAQTLRKKAALAENRGIREGFFMLPEVADIAGELLG